MNRMKHWEVGREELQDGHQTGIAAKRADDRSRLKGLLALVLVIIAVGIVVACVAVPTFGFILMMGFVASSYLVLYIGIPLATATWGLSLAYLVFARKEGWRVLWTGAKYGVIIFGTMGALFWVCGIIRPSAKTFTAGYWLHAKVWVDVEEVRTWAAERGAVSARVHEIPRREWPSSLRDMAWSPGWLEYDANSGTVTLVEGGGSGHWGLTVAPKGTPTPFGWCVYELEDGAWVWHEFQ